MFIMIKDKYGTLKGRRININSISTYEPVTIPTRLPRIDIIFKDKISAYHIDTPAKFHFKTKKERDNVIAQLDKITELIEINGDTKLSI